MLTPQDREAIEDLFYRLDSVARENPDRDAEAEALIADKLRYAPEAPYYMAQTIVVQEHALRVAQERIAELEEQSQRPAGGLFGGLFGDRGPSQSSGRHPARYQGDGGGQRQGGGGGFLAGAAQTALGVTGGVLLGSAIAGMFSPDSASAEEPMADDTGPVDDGGGDFGGDDFGF